MKSSSSLMRIDTTYGRDLNNRRHSSFACSILKLLTQPKAVGLGFRVKSPNSPLYNAMALLESEAKNSNTTYSSRLKAPDMKPYIVLYQLQSDIRKKSEECHCISSSLDLLRYRSHVCPCRIWQTAAAAADHIIGAFVDMLI